jgi:hypothetical protein
MIDDPATVIKGPLLKPILERNPIAINEVKEFGIGGMFHVNQLNPAP